MNKYASVKSQTTEDTITLSEYKFEALPLVAVVKYDKETLNRDNLEQYLCENSKMQYIQEDEGKIE